MESLREIFLKKWRPYAWIAGLTFLLYLPTLWFKFSYLDDNVLILKNFDFISHLSNLPQIFKQGIFEVLHTPQAYYRPIFTLSFMLNAVIGKTAPFIYHFSNLIFHLIASMLVFNLFKKLGYEKILSFLVALIFAFHPLLTSAVAWIPGRIDALLAIFIFSSFILCLDFYRLRSRKSILFFFAHLAFFALAVLTQENALLLPIVILTYLYLTEGKKIFSLKTLLLILGWTLIIYFFWQIRNHALNQPIPLNFLHLSQTILKNSPALLIYLGKLILPFHLSTYPIFANSPLIWGWLGAAVLAILFILSTNIRSKNIIFGLVWLLIFLVPTFAQISSNTSFPILEQRIYLPMIGFLIILLETDLFKNILRGKISNLAWIAILLGTLAGFTLLNSQNYKNQLVFWENAVKTSPASAFAHNNLGAMYYLDSRLLAAGSEFQQAIKQNSTEPMAHNNLGLILMSLGKNKEAEAEFKQELKINPKFDNAHFNLGLLYDREKKSDQAIEEWKKTLEINPQYWDAYAQLINYYSKQKDQEKAKHYLEEYKKHGGKIKQ